MNHFYDPDTQSGLLGIHPEMSNEEYHQKQPGISSSMLKTMKKSPAHFWARHLDPERSRDESPILIFGRAAHALVLEGQEAFNKEFVLAPNRAKRSNADKEFWAEFTEVNKDKDIIKVADYELIKKMADKMNQHPAAKPILEDESAVAEYSGFWVDEDTGLLCKFRPDWWIQRGHSAIIDYKTTVDASPDGFSRQIHNYGYGHSAAWYLEGLLNTTGEKCDNFVFLAQEKTPEQGFAVAVYVLDEEVIELCRNVNKILLRRIADALHKNEWHGYNNDEITQISLPPWGMTLIGG